MTLLPMEVQGYIRHILHAVGVAIVAYSGHSPDSIEMWVGLAVNAISLGWFLVVTYLQHKKQREEQNLVEYETSDSEPSFDGE